MSRTTNSLKNVIVAFITQMFSIILGIFSRAVFIKTLGVEYLGIGGLFSTVISVLALTNLGLGEALLYLMIKHFANKDQTKIKATFEFSKKVFLILGFIIAGIGIIIMPIVFMVINLETDIPYIHVYYCMFVLNTSLSYLCGPYNLVFRADQKVRVSTRIQFWANSIISILQILTLYLFKNYVIYLILMIMSNIVNYVLIHYVFGRTYKYLIRKNSEYKLEVADKEEIKQSVKGMFVIKLSGTIMESIDNITISELIGIIYVGIYSNYLVVTSAIRSFIKLIYQSVYSSIGNLNLSSDADIRKKFFEIETFFFHVITTVAISGIYLLIQDFITMWIGNEFLLSKLEVAVICIDLYINILQYSQENFVQTTGLFKKTKYLSFGMAISNLILSIILGIKMGLAGILLATVISRGIMQHGIRAIFIYKELFSEKVTNYYYMIFKYIFVAFGEIAIVNVLIGRINGSIWYLFLVKMILTVVLSTFILWLAHRKNSAYEYLLNKMKELIKNYHKSVNRNR